MAHPRTLHRRPAQRVASRGVLVAAGLAAAVGLQLAGPQLQCRLADWVGIARIAPAPAPHANVPMPMRGVKVAQVVACIGVAPAAI